MKSQPNYRKIYNDIIQKDYRHKEVYCVPILNKKTDLTSLDVIKLNNIIFGTRNKVNEDINQKHRSYCKVDILGILSYQKRNKLNNSQLAVQFKISRNTVAKWKKNYGSSAKIGG